MPRLLLLVCATVLSAPLWAMQCPSLMIRIDDKLNSDPPRDAATLAKVRQLRTEGEELHDSGNHSQAMQVLGQALKILESSE